MPDPEIQFLQARLVIARMGLKLLDITANTFLGSDRPVSSADDIFLLGAVFVGQAENRPMTATKLAHYTKVPRPTVVRKIADLKAKGIVELRGTKILIPLHKLNLDRRLALVKDAARAVLKAAEELSKMDILELERDAADPYPIERRSKGSNQRVGV